MMMIIEVVGTSVGKYLGSGRQTPLIHPHPAPFTLSLLFSPLHSLFTFVNSLHPVPPLSFFLSLFFFFFLAYVLLPSSHQLARTNQLINRSKKKKKKEVCPSPMPTIHPSYNKSRREKINWKRGICKAYKTETGQKEKVERKKFDWDKKKERQPELWFELGRKMPPR